MARPKGKLFALLAVFAAIGLVAASGAFTTVEADRTADVNTAGDDSALLQLDPSTSSNGEDYASTVDGQLELDLAGASGDGVNLDANTNVDDVFKVTNQGTQEITLHITKSGDNTGLVTFYEGTASGTSGTPIGTSDSNDIDITTGETVTISINIDTTDQTTLTGGEDILTEVTLVANQP